MKNLVLHANTTILPLQYDYCLFNTTILPLQYDYCLFNTTILPLQYDYCLFNTIILHLQYDYFAPSIRLLPLKYDCCQIRPISSQYDLRPSYTTILSLIPLHTSITTVLGVGLNQEIDSIATQHREVFESTHVALRISLPLFQPVNCIFQKEC